MPVIAAGQPVPEFSLARREGPAFTRADLLGHTTVLVFYPFAFSPVCTDQLSVYEEAVEDLAERGATLYGVSCDAVWSQQAFKDKLGVAIEQLSDFEPKGATCRAFGVYHPGGFPQRALELQACFRHFPVRASHPRAHPAACAAEAAALQGAFWEMHDALFADPARLEDPHLWRRAERLGLDLDRFERDRRSNAVAERVQRDFRSGVRAGVVTTPTLFVDGQAYAGVPGDELLARLA